MLVCEALALNAAAAPDPALAEGDGVSGAQPAQAHVRIVRSSATERWLTLIAGEWNS